MKPIRFFLLAACILGAGCDLMNKTQKERYHVAIFGTRTDCPVVITGIPLWAQSAIVRSGEREVPSQLDRALNELVFVDNFSKSRNYKVVYSSKPSKALYPARVYAQMLLRNPDGSLQAVDTLTADLPDLSGKLLHDGPVFESQMAAYRIRFDAVQTVDSYGKKSPQLELARTGWNTSEEQVQQGFGSGDLRAGGSAGIGTLKGWAPESCRMTDIVDCKRREVRILAKGPIRTVVEVRAEGWRYCGREINLVSRYILYAGHSCLQVENTIEGDFKGLVFCTGVVKMARNKVVKDQHVIATLGNNLLSPAPSDREGQRVGLAVAVSRKQMVSQIDDAASYLLQLTPDARGRIDYTVDVWWQRSEWLQGFGDDGLLLGVIGSVRQAGSEIIVSHIP